MTEAGQREAFLRAICEDPKDDAPRLMYADWLDEHGEPERAEFIRVQLVLGGPCIFRGKPWPNSPLARCALPAGCPKCANYDALRGLERELLRARGWRWAPQLPDACWICNGVGLGGSGRVFMADFRRGFVAAVTLPADAWHRHADALCAACPLEEVTLTTGLEFDRDWGFIDSDMCIVYLLAVEPHTEIDVTELPEGFNLIAALLAKRWPRITFRLPEDRR